MGNKAVNAAGSQTRPLLPQDLAFQSVFEQTIRRGGHVEADTVNATGSQARPRAHPPHFRALHSNIQQGFRGQALVVKTGQDQSTCRRRRGNKVVNAGKAPGTSAPLPRPAFKPPTRLQASQQFALDLRQTLLAIFCSIAGV